MKASGLSVSGIILGVPLPGYGSVESTSFQPNAHILISPEQGVLLTIPIPEVGQNTRTALAMIMADELGADLHTVNLKQAGPDKALGFQMAGASAGLKRSYPTIRLAAATARHMLIQAAAKQWGVGPESCRTESSHVLGPDAKKISFEDIALKASEIPLPENPELKLPKEFKYIGKEIHVLDSKEIGMGRTRFAIDAMPDGVRFAVLKRCPVLDGTLVSFNAKEAESLPGVVDILKVEDAIAVIAVNTWIAMQAAERLEVVWDYGPNASVSTASHVQAQKAAVADPEKTGFTRGDFQSAFEGSTHQLDQSFSAPFLCHAPMEPPVCTAWYHDGELEIWTGCQSLHQLYDALPDYAGLPNDKITFHQMRMGGGFGRKLEHDFIIEALRVARRVDYPVKLMFTKADDIRHSSYRAADRYRYRVGLDKNGYPKALQEISCRSARTWRASKFAFHFNHVERKFTDLPLPLISGPYRGPHDNVSCFTQQSMTDAMAESCGIDRIEYRLAMLGDSEALSQLGWPAVPYEDPIMARLLKIVRRRSNWKASPNYGYGVAFFEKNESKKDANSRHKKSSLLR